MASHLREINKPKPKVYVGNGSQGPSETGWTCGNYAWGVMVANAGGSNITEGAVRLDGKETSGLKKDEITQWISYLPPGEFAPGCLNRV